MKKLSIVLIVLIVFLSSSFAQLPQGQFAIGSPYCGGACGSGGESIIQAKDGGYVISGWTYAYGPQLSGAGNIYILKLSGEGNLLWTKAIGGKNGEDGICIVQTNDHGYAIAGSTQSFSFSSGADPYVIKVDSNGNLLWTKVVGGISVGDFAYSIVQTYDYGYAITGLTSSYGTGGEDVYVIKLDSVGNLKWTKTIGGAGDEYGNSIIQTDDKGLAIVGATTSYGAGSGDVYVIKLDSIGNLKWTKTVGGAGDDEGYSIFQTIDRGYVITGETESYGAGGYDVYVIRLDSLGNLKWTKTIGGTEDDYGTSIVQTNDLGYIITGNTESYVKNSPCTPASNIYVIKLDSTGGLVWTKSIGEGCDGGNSIIQTTDKGYAITGYTGYRGGLDARNVYMIKIDSLGNTCADIDTNGGLVSSGGMVSSGGVVSSGGMVSSGGLTATGGEEYVICDPTAIPEVKKDNNEISVYPSPSNGIFTLTLSNVNTVCTIEIYNMLGEKIYTQPLPQAQTNNIINLTGQPQGIYFYRVLKEDGSLIGNGKLIIEK